jgi:Xaa-Pro aminopeptidase
MSDISKRLNQIRNWMGENNYDAFIVPHDDEYMSEYLPPQNERLEWITGFNGSAGIAVITGNSAAIFVDGRYTIQVQNQVSNDYFEIKHLVENPYLKWIEKNTKENSKIGYDAKLHTRNWLKNAKKSLTNGQILVSIENNPIDINWINRPKVKNEKAILLNEEFTGKSSKEKRLSIGKSLVKNNLDGAFITALDSICWLLNIRGQDVPCNPVLLSHAVIFSNGDVELFIAENKIPDGFIEHVGTGVRTFSPLDLKNKLSNLAGKKIGYDMGRGNSWAADKMEDGGAEVINFTDPCTLQKACKNEIEAQGMRDCHIVDGVAVSKFLAWIERCVKDGILLDEGELADKLEEFRKSGDKFMGISFDTISAVGGNAAMCHYNHTNQDIPGKMEMDSIYLVDSGGQYLDGTTDITRTIAIGTPSQSAKKAFTLVLKGHIALGKAIFPKGTSGMQLDPLARQFLWQHGMDYDHGTGHGVGHFLNVHEGPQGIGKKGSSVPLEIGMVLSNEPGYYETDTFGFRCENLVLVKSIESSGNLETMGFEDLTMVPFDKNLLDLSLMNNSEIEWLNEYHQNVWNKISPFLNGEDLKWLKIQTEKI